MKKFILFTGLVNMIFVPLLYAQLNIAVTHFSNNSNILVLDSWESTVPSLLRSELARSKHIILVERDKLAAIFEEQKLALAGFIDSSKIKDIGNLAGADFIVSGNIQKARSQPRSQPAQQRGPIACPGCAVHAGQDLRSRGREFFGKLA